jgi:CheY-like chemotaxis protein
MISSHSDIELAGEAAKGMGAVARQPRPNVILMDIPMPEMDGIEARRIKAEPKVPGIFTDCG